MYTSYLVLMYIVTWVEFFSQSFYYNVLILDIVYYYDEIKRKKHININQGVFVLNYIEL